MNVQIYDDETPARVFAPGDSFMTCELNANSAEEAEARMRNLGWRRAAPWKPTEWGFQTNFRRAAKK